MPPNISEFSYGYALTDDLIHANAFGATTAPVFPSLIQEGSVGYDLALNSPGLLLFLQFKLSHCMVRNTATEIRRDNVFPLNTRFYRFYLHRTNHSDQHRLLLDLEAAGNEVYYVAPGFHQPAELDATYLAGSVRTNSVFVRPSWIGPIPDTAQHHVAFTLNGPMRKYSKPEPLKGDARYDAVAEQVRSKVRSERRPVSEHFARLPDEMMGIVRNYADKLRRGKRKEDLLTRVNQLDVQKVRKSPLAQFAYISRTFFGCEPLVVQPSPEQGSIE